jgi:hypothetical protein
MARNKVRPNDPCLCGAIKNRARAGRSRAKQGQDEDRAEAPGNTQQEHGDG